jgi:catechol 2,3-dioxygenase-like lactoylglutathione lyase family enzyme
MTYRLDHIGIAVKNLEDGIAFYGRVVALGEPTIKEIPFAAPSLIRAPA